MSTTDPEQPASAPAEAVRGSTEEDRGVEAEVRGLTKRTRLAVIGIVLAQLALMLHAAWRVGPTYDEHYYATAGLAYWRDGQLSFNREHPPLGKYLIGLPLTLQSDLVWDEHGIERVSPPVRFFFQDNAEKLDRNLFLARLPAVLATVAFSAALFLLIARSLGAVPALIALCGFAFNANVLAQGSVAALDGLLMVAFFASVWTFVRSQERPGVGRALVGGFAFGVAVLVKFTSLVLIPAFVVLAGIKAWRRRSWQPLVWTAALFLVGFTTFAAAYGFEAISANEARADLLLATGPGDGDAVSEIFTQKILAEPIRLLFGDERPVPLLTALKGLDYQLDATGLGHKSVYRGRPLSAADFREGNPYPEYYLVVLAIKNALPWVLLVLAGAWTFTRDKRWSKEARSACVVVPLAVLLLFSTGKALMGARYVLPVFPFFCLWTAAAARRWPKLATVLVALSVVSTLRVHPQYLMYYSAIVGSRGPGISVVSDDWGQGVREMGAFYERNAAEIEAAGGLWYEPYTVGDPRAFGLDRVRALPELADEDTPLEEGAVKGIVAVHALSYWRDVYEADREQRKYSWLDEYEPFTTIDRSVYVYDTRAGSPGSDPGWR